MTQIKGMVLAGGKSKRFGSNKALARIQGKTLLEQAVGTLRCVGLEPAVLAGKSQDYSFLNCEVFQDFIPSCGPLGGLYTAFHFCPQRPLLVLTCDMPKITPRTLLRLMNRRNSSAQATLFRLHSERKQPFLGIYQPSIFPKVSAALLAGKLSMQSLLNGLERLSEIDPECDPDEFANVNEQKDLELLQL